MKAYAKVSQEENSKAASPEDKAIALQCTVVEKYNRYSLEERDNDARLGVHIFKFGYITTFVLTFSIAPFFMELLFTTLNVFSNNSGDQTGSNSNLSGRSNANKERELENRSDARNERESDANNERELKNRSDADNDTDNYKKKLYYVAGSVVTFPFFSVSIIIQATGISHQPINEFEKLKIGFLIVLVLWLIIIAVMYYMCCKCRKNVNAMAFFCVLGLAVFTTDIMLSFVPSFLLLFAFPISSSALLVLHIAIFYCVIILVAAYFALLGGKQITKLKQKTKIKTRCCTIGYIIMFGLGVILIFVVLSLTYACILFFFQFVIIRKKTTNVSLSTITLYSPPLVIAVFGFLIKKGAFEQHTNKEEEETKAKQMLLEQARKIWSVFGNRLLEGEDNDVPLGQTKIKDLAQNLKKPSKGETRGS